MTATLLYPVVLLAHVARDASKVLENFERMLEIDVPHNSSLPVSDFLFVEGDYRREGDRLLFVNIVRSVSTLRRSCL